MADCPKLGPPSTWYQHHNAAFSHKPLLTLQGELVSLSSQCRPRLARLMQHLTQQCGWKYEQVHLFGFSQGGTAVLDFTLHSRSVAIKGNATCS